MVISAQEDLSQQPLQSQVRVEDALNPNIALLEAQQVQSVQLEHIQMELGFSLCQSVTLAQMDMFVTL
jgi:hypothetical protein